ncbi:MAG: PDZ domain-containing protein [Chloroflexales bacterium]|nr:PDZ domain-containing protein [Chloroflexales bacterium]
MPAATVSVLPTSPRTATPQRTATIQPTATLAPTATPSATPTASTTSTPEPPTAIPTPTLIGVSQRDQLFEETWRIVKDHYLYRDFRGQDWNSIRDEFAPRVEAAANNEEFYAALADMVGRLNDDHSRFLAPSDASVEDALSTGREAYVGIGVLLVPRTEGALVQEVFPDGPAARAGLLPRDRIVAIDGAPFDSLDDGSDLYGPEGSPVRLTVVRPGESTRDVVVTRAAVQGRVVPSTRRLRNDIGYLKVPTFWVNDMDVQVSGALTDMVAESPLNGLILDLRGNPGGWNYVLTGILGHFTRGQVGIFFDQKTTKPLLVTENAGPDMRGTPLVVLVDHSTASYAEVMAAVLQREAGARVVGAPTAGNTETIYAYELAGGARLWVAQEGFKLLNGQNLEGRGVQPNSVVNVDWATYSEDDDPQILEARRLLTAAGLNP